MVTLSTWRARMDEDMRLRDFRQRTREGYALAVRQFVNHVKREPRTYTEEDLGAYVLYLRDERKLSPSTVNIGVHAVRFTARIGAHSVDCSSCSLRQMKSPEATRGLVQYSGNVHRYSERNREDDEGKDGEVASHVVFSRWFAQIMRHVVDPM